MVPSVFSPILYIRHATSIHMKHLDLCTWPKPYLLSELLYIFIYSIFFYVHKNSNRLNMWLKLDELVTCASNQFIKF